MYVHPAFAMDDNWAINHLRTRGFGLLALSTSGAPVSTHVPFLVEKQLDGKYRILLHVARNNPLCRQITSGCQVLLVCQGPDAYISPDWYGVPNQVPTWAYSSVHVTGHAQLLPESENMTHVESLSNEFERRLLPKPVWTMAKINSSQRQAMLKAIVSIAIDIESIESQKKLIQHKGKREHTGVIAGLNAHRCTGSHEIAVMIQEVLSDKA